jgi:hypothetical protein
MKSYTIDNTMLLIGKDTSALAVTIAGLTDGELCVFKEDLTPLGIGDTVTDSEYIQIFQGVADTTDGTPRSHKIYGRGIKSWYGKSYTTPTQQVSYVGWNTVYGDIVANADEVYTLSVIFDVDKSIYGEKQHVRRFHYTSTAADTNATIATAFVNMINADEEAKKYVVAAVVAGGGGEKGIRLTGLVQPHKVGFDYQLVRFQVVIMDEAAWDTTPVTDSAVKANPGSGTYDLVLDLEQKCLRGRGLMNTIQWPVDNLPTYAVSGATYDMYFIEYVDPHAGPEAVFGKLTDNYKQIIIALPAGANSVRARLEGQLNPWMLSTPSAFTPVAL